MEFDTFVLVASARTLATEPAAREHADAVELRMDLADDPLSELAAYDGRLPVIATNRSADEGGEAPETTQRLEDLRAAAEHAGVGAIDVELATIDAGAGRGVVEHAREHGCAVITSVHEFATTPPPDELVDLLERAAGAGDVGKLAVTAGTPRDVLDLLEATWARTAAGDLVATMAMGTPGRHSRAVAPLYGSRIGYAPVDPDAATAPGQYDLATLRRAIDLLGGPWSED